MGGWPGRESGWASCDVSLRQSVSWNDEEFAWSGARWTVGSVYGDRVISGKSRLTPQNRDFEPIFFNLDRGRTLLVTLSIGLTWNAAEGGIIVLGPLEVSIPPWRVYSLD